MHLHLKLFDDLDYYMASLVPIHSYTVYCKQSKTGCLEGYKTQQAARQVFAVSNSVQNMTSRKKFSEGKQAHVGMDASKTRWESMTPQHFHTIPRFGDLLVWYFSDAFQQS